MTTITSEERAEIVMGAISNLVDTIINVCGLDVEFENDGDKMVDKALEISIEMLTKCKQEKFIKINTEEDDSYSENN